MSSFGLLFKRLDPEIKRVKPTCGWFSVWPAVHPLQGGSSPLRTLQRGVSGGHRLQGPNRASAERSVQEGGGPRAQGPRGQRAHGASVWGQRPGHKRRLRPQHQVRWRRWWERLCFHTFCCSERNGWTVVARRRAFPKASKRLIGRFEFST